MLRTRVGYAGGSTVDPTYHDLADHTEVFQIDFDPARLGYADLLDQIWANRRGGRSSGRSQYMEAVFCADEAQERIARARGITAPIITGAAFYLAEDYHQKYYLRHDSVLMHELADYTPAELVRSTIAARLNGYVAGRGTAAQLAEEVARFELSAAARTHVERLVARR
ncbi:MAG: peptide-methionine (S)-S-oxide reductase [Deltaproteobacteria bacterium]|nr:peptide-methionine (S)-S-oxide reductase [Deltaproteobacteria bacterium]